MRLLTKAILPLTAMTISLSSALPAFAQKATSLASAPALTRDAMQACFDTLKRQDFDYTGRSENTTCRAKISGTGNTEDVTFWVVSGTKRSSMTITPTSITIKPSDTNSTADDTYMFIQLASGPMTMTPVPNSDFVPPAIKAIRNEGEMMRARLNNTNWTLPTVTPAP